MCSKLPEFFLLFFLHFLGVENLLAANYADKYAHPLLDYIDFSNTPDKKEIFQSPGDYKANLCLQDKVSKLGGASP